MLNPEVYPILSRYEYLDEQELKESIKNMSDKEKEMAEKEAGDLLGILSAALEPFVKSIEGMAKAMAPVIKDFYNGLPEEIKINLQEVDMACDTKKGGKKKGGKGK